MAAQREKVDILPIEKLVYMPTNLKLGDAGAINPDTAAIEKASESVDDQRMVVVER